MSRKSRFKHHRFPRGVILCAVRWYLRYPLSCLDVVDLLAERGVAVDRSTVYRWVQKFGPELAKRTERHLRRANFDWQVPYRDIASRYPFGQWTRPTSASAVNGVASGARSMRTVRWSISV